MKEKLPWILAAVLLVALAATALIFRSDFQRQTDFLRTRISTLESRLSNVVRPEDLKISDEKIYRLTQRIKFNESIYREENKAITEYLKCERYVIFELLPVPKEAADKLSDKAIFAEMFLDTAYSRADRVIPLDIEK